MSKGPLLIIIGLLLYGCIEHVQDRIISNKLEELQTRIEILEGGR